jgi:replicative DNA helicase
MTNPFDQTFQEQLAAHYLRDDIFVQAVGSLVEPDHFDNQTLAALVAVQKSYLERYGACCTLKTFVQVMQRMVASKLVKVPDMNEAKRLLLAIHKDPLQDRQFVIDTIADFSRSQALANSALVLVDALDTGERTKIDKALAVVEEAKEIGSVDVEKGMDFVSSRQERAQFRALRAAGTYSNGGIPTGSPELDAKLTPHRGWGRKELSILMAPPKGGKTAAMIQFAKAAAQSGKNVFYASCEVSEQIIGDRLDASIASIPMKELETRHQEVDQAVAAWESQPGMGKFIIQAFPIRTLKVSALRRILKKYQAQGIDFDLIVVDYLGILKPEQHYAEKRFALADIGHDLRAMATTFNAAVLTAYQTNREGTRKAQRAVADGTDAADDYEVVRTADALITINADEDMRTRGEVILYFSEMRNAESGIRLRYEQNLSCGQFMTKFKDYS